MKNLFLLLLFVSLYSCSEEKSNCAEKITPEKIVTETFTENPKTEIGKMPDTEYNVRVKFLHSYEIRSEIGGEIEFILEEGKSFKTGDLLVQLNNRVVFDQLVSEKKSLVLAYQNLKQQFKTSEENTNWLNFETTLSPYKLLPELPENSKTNTDKDFLAIYEKSAELESKMKSHFILAEKDGIVLQRKKSVGRKVSPNEVLIISGKSRRKVFLLPAELFIKNESDFELKKNSGSESYKLTIGKGGKVVEVPTKIPIGEYVLIRSLPQ